MMIDTEARGVFLMVMSMMVLMMVMIKRMMGMMMESCSNWLGARRGRFRPHSVYLHTSLTCSHTGSLTKITCIHVH